MIILDQRLRPREARLEQAVASIKRQTYRREAFYPTQASILGA